MKQPATAEYAPKTQKSGGITALMDTLIKELEVGNADSENAEKTAQKDYEELLADAEKSKKEDNKAIADKKAENATYIADLHKSCDFILANFEERKEARTNEVE